MSPPRNSADDSRHRFFHAMVLMGGSLALGCGGATTQAPSASGGSTAGGAASGGAPGSGGVSSGGTPGSNGGAPASGGASGGGSGGSIIVIGHGGAPVVPGPFDCPPEQWDCSGTSVLCSGRTYALPDKCACDPKRPLTGADCPPDQVQVCRNATVDSHGNYFTEPVAFECSCTPRQMNCRQECDQVFPDTGQCTQSSSAMNSVLCDCAVIVLR